MLAAGRQRMEVNRVGQERAERGTVLDGQGPGEALTRRVRRSAADVVSS